MSVHLCAHTCIRTCVCMHVHVCVCMRICATLQLTYNKSGLPAGYKTNQSSHFDKNT